MAPRLKLLFLQREKFQGKVNSREQTYWEFSVRKVFSCRKYQLDKIQMSQVLARDLALTLCSLIGKQVIRYVVPTILLKRHQGTSGNCTSHLQDSREAKNYILILYVLIFSYSQNYSGSQNFGAVCGEKTLHVMMDFHFPDS